MEKLKKQTIFIVEENEEFSFMLDYLISRDNDCRIVRFKNKEECLQSLDQRPGLIFLDDPRSALSTLRQIKTILPEAHVVVLADREDIDTAIRFMMEGAEDYLMKNKEDLAQIRDIVDTVLYTQ